MSSNTNPPSTATTNRYVLNILKRIGETVLEWSITDTTTGKTVGSGDSSGYAGAVELVAAANAGGRTL